MNDIETTASCWVGRPRRVSLPIRFSARTQTRSSRGPGAGNVSRRCARLRKIRRPFIRAELARRHSEKQDRGSFQKGWARDIVHRHEFLSDEFSEKFVSVGFWNHDLGPHEWKPEPDEMMHRAEFWQVMRDCLSKLPQKIRAVFTMCEMDGVPGKEVCATLSISDSNLWVMLHRARMALRECLEINWFDTPAGGTA